MRHCVYPHANPNAMRRTLAANMDVDYSPIAEERDFYIFPYDMRHCVYPHTNPTAVRRTLAANMDVEYNPVSTRTAG